MINIFQITTKPAFTFHILLMSIKLFSYDRLIVDASYYIKAIDGYLETVVEEEK